MLPLKGCIASRRGLGRGIPDIPSNLASSKSAIPNRCNFFPSLTDFRQTKSPALFFSHANAWNARDDRPVPFFASMANGDTHMPEWHHFATGNKSLDLLEVAYINSADQGVIVLKGGHVLKPPQDELEAVHKALKFLANEAEQSDD